MIHARKEMIPIAEKKNTPKEYHPAKLDFEGDTIHAKVLRAYHESGGNLTRTAELSGVCRNTCRRYLISAGVYKPKKAVQVEILMGWGWSAKKIGEFLGISDVTVWGWMPIQRDFTVPYDQRDKRLLNYSRYYLKRTNPEAYEYWFGEEKRAREAKQREKIAKELAEAIERRERQEAQAEAARYKHKEKVWVWGLGWRWKYVEK